MTFGTPQTHLTRSLSNLDTEIQTYFSSKISVPYSFILKIQECDTQYNELPTTAVLAYRRFTSFMVCGGNKKKEKKTVQCFWMLPVFWTCDLQNKSSLWNHTKIRLKRKIKLYCKVAGYSRVSHSWNKHNTCVSAAVQPPTWSGYVLSGNLPSRAKETKGPC